MKSITKLKNEARQYELKENWNAAVEAYQKVLRAGEEQDTEDDLPLYNRIGDLYLRMGQSDEAVGYYSEAAEKYAASGLYNNAIALCNKALRYRPEEPSLYRQLGDYSAEQGFLVDARRWYLEYAERKVKAGEVEGALNALEEFADLSNDPEVREILAEQLVSAEQTDDAVRQLEKAYGEWLQRGNGEAAGAVGEKLRELDPSIDLAAIEVAPAPAAEAEEEEPEAELAVESAAGAVGLPAEAEAEAEPVTEEEPEPAPDEIEIERTVGELDTGVAAEEEVSGLEVGFGEREHEAEPADDVALGGLETFGEEAADEVEEEPEEAEPLPMLGEEPEEAEAAVDVEEAEELEEAEEEEAEPLPMLGAEEEAEPVGTLDLEDMGELGAEEEGAVEAEAFDVGSLDLSFTGEEAGAVAEAETGEEAPSAEDAGVDTASVLDRARELVGRGLGTQALTELRLLLVARAEPDVYRQALGVVDELIRQDPDDLAALQRRVELASRMDDSDVLARNYLDLARCLVRQGVETKAATVYQRALDLDPSNEEAREALDLPEAGEEAEAADDYVDLAAFLDEDAAMQAAGGPALEADQFSDLFSRFKAKVTEDVAVEDAGSHYDLGLAFKEMGLIDEAISEFQTALKGGEERLKVYEELGQCFIMKGQYNVAVKVLNRALELPREDETELLGVFYHLGLCHEELGDRDEARASYDKIMQIDASFRDVPERLSRL